MRSSATDPIEMQQILEKINTLIEAVNNLKFQILTNHSLTDDGKNRLVNWLHAIVEPIFDAFKERDTDTNPLAILHDREKILPLLNFTNNPQEILSELQTNIALIDKVLRSKIVTDLFMAADFTVALSFQKEMLQVLAEIKQSLTSLPVLDEEENISNGLVSEPQHSYNSQKHTHEHRAKIDINNNNRSDEPSSSPSTPGQDKNYDNLNAELKRRMHYLKGDLDKFYAGRKIFDIILDPFGVNTITSGNLFSYTNRIMTLVGLGANPNLVVDGLPLIHMLFLADFVAAKKLVGDYGADINTVDANGMTILQNLMLVGNFSGEVAYELVKLGGDPETKLKDGTTLLECMSKNNKSKQGDNPWIKAIAEIIERQKTNHLARNEFLNFMFYLARDLAHTGSQSFFSKLPIDIMLVIFSYLDFVSMGKTWQEGVSLARTILVNPQVIKDNSQTPGGINIFQITEMDETGSPLYKFNIFKSIKAFDRDVQKYKKYLIANQNPNDFSISEKISGKVLTRASEALLKAFIEKHAISYWLAHTNLHRTTTEKQKIIDSVKDPDLKNTIQKHTKKK